MVNRKVGRKDSSKYRFVAYECNSCGAVWNRDGNVIDGDVMGQTNPICSHCGESEDVTLLLAPRHNEEGGVAT